MPKASWRVLFSETFANSDAALDLYDRGVKLGSAISTPLLNGDRRTRDSAGAAQPQILKAALGFVGWDLDFGIWGFGTCSMTRTEPTVFRN